MEEKLNKLNSILEKMGSVLIAYSGGVDSTFLLKVAQNTLHEKAIAVTASSPTYPPKELEEAKDLARRIGAKHIVIETNELKSPEFTSNPPERCYYCKKELFSLLKKIAEEKKVKYIADGSNADDRGDFRPGTKAAGEFGVRSPLKEAGLTKKDIRILSKNMGLPTWEKPSLACLSSRFPYGMRINQKDLRKVARAEELLKKLGFSHIRVRHHKHTARVEVPPHQIPRITQKKIREKIVEELKNIGYTYITVDLEGYRTGSMNEVLPGK